jgi:amino acid transporter
VIMTQRSMSKVTHSGQTGFRREVGLLALTFISLGGFTAGWVAWIQAVTVAPVEVEAALSYLDHVWHGLINDVGALTPIGFGVATVLMLVFTVINILGVRWLAESNTITVLWKIAVLLCRLFGVTPISSG